MPRFIGVLVARYAQKFKGYLYSTGSLVALKIKPYHFFRGKVTWRMFWYSLSTIQASLTMAGKLARRVKPIFRSSLSVFSGSVTKRLRKLRKSSLASFGRFSGAISFIYYLREAKRMYGTLKKRIWIQKSFSSSLRILGNLDADKIGLDIFYRYLPSFLNQVGSIRKRIRIQKTTTGVMNIFSGFVAWSKTGPAMLHLLGTFVRKFMADRYASGLFQISGILTLIAHAKYIYQRGTSGRSRMSGKLYSHASGNLIEILYYGPEI